MKKFLILLSFTLIMFICEVGKYLFNYNFFYFALVLQIMGMLLAIWVFSSKKKYNKILSFLVLLCVSFCPCKIL